MKCPFEVRDVVKYSSRFLRDTGQFDKATSEAQFTIKNIESLCAGKFFLRFECGARGMAGNYVKANKPEMFE